MQARASFPAELESAASARRFTEGRLHTWGCDGLAEAARLLVSELVVNAVLHAGSSASVVLRFDGRCLRGEVGDESRVAPMKLVRSPSAPTGRGLVIVDALADRWGVDRRPGGKVVWFELCADSLEG